MARKPKSLGSAKATHTEEGKKAVREIERAAERVHASIKGGACFAATMNYADMQRAVAVAEVHMRSGGQGIWIPQTTIVEAAGAYTDRCVRLKPHEPGTTMDGSRRKRRR